MSRGIDHIVICAADLDALASRYQGLGFTLTPRAQHPFGTGNQLAQMQGDFIELLSVTQPQDITEPEPGAFSFGAYNRDYLKQSDGFSMIALKSHGWQQDREHFKAHGLDVSAPFEFSRLAGQPDGTEVTVGFKLTIATHPEMPWAVFFTCDHQHEAQYFYKPQFQSHANTATGISEVMMVADQPAKYASYFEALLGEGSVSQHGESLSVQAGGSVISVGTRKDLFERFPGAGLPTGSDARFVGYGISVDDISRAEACVLASGLGYEVRGPSLWLSGSETSNIIIEFTQASAALK